MNAAAIYALRSRAARLATDHELPESLQQFWKGYAKGLDDLVGTAGAQAAAKDETLGDQAQGGGLTAGARLPKGAEQPATAAVSQSDTAQGLQLAADRRTDLQVDRVEQLDGEEVAVVHISDNEHAAQRVDRNDGAGSHVSSVRPRHAHTPGPWWFNGTHIRKTFDVRTAEGQSSYRLASVECDFVTYVPESMANGRLMAAAPDLLDAARAAAAILGRQKWIAGSTDPEAIALFKLRAAIAKATENAGTCPEWSAA